MVLNNLFATERSDWVDSNRLRHNCLTSKKGTRKIGKRSRCVDKNCMMPHMKQIILQTLLKMICPIIVQFTHLRPFHIDNKLYIICFLLS